MRSDCLVFLWNVNILFFSYRKLFSQFTRESCQMLSYTVFFIWSSTGPFPAIFARDLDGMRVIVTVNNDDSDAEMNLPTGSAPEYVGALTGQKVSAQGGRIRVRVAANSGEIWLPAGDMPDSVQ